jgi:hypothetical protein
MQKSKNKKKSEKFEKIENDDFQLNQDMDSIFTEEFFHFTDSRFTKSRKSILASNEEKLAAVVKPFIRIPTKLKPGHLKAVSGPEIPKGIFVSPLLYDFSTRSKDNYEITFIPYIDKFFDFAGMLKTVKWYLESWFFDYPHNREEQEVICCPEFVIYMFVKLVRAQYSMDIILNYFSKAMRKRKYTLYKLISDFFTKGRLPMKPTSVGEGKQSKISRYRFAYCNFCNMYLCRVHFCERFKKRNSGLDLERKNEYLFDRILEKTSLEVQFRTAIPKKENSRTGSPSIPKCEMCRKVGSNNQYKTKPPKELVKLMDLKDLYKFLVFLDTGESYFMSPCYWNTMKILSNKYNCQLLEALITIGSVNGYKSAEIVYKDTDLPKGNPELLKTINIKPKVTSPKKGVEKNCVKKYDYEPCSHEGLCDKKCPCVKKR